MKLKASYDNFDEASDETGLECLDATKTQQHDEHEANINNIVARYLKTGEIALHNKPPLMTDFEHIDSPQEALQLLVDARSAFMEQPAEVRARFNNDPSTFVEFCSNENNRDDMRKMGLLSDDELQRHQAELEGKARLAAAQKADAEAYRKALDAPKS